MEIAAALVELGIILAPAALGLGIALAVILRNAPGDRQLRVRRLLIGVTAGTLVAIAGYRWMLDGAGDGWWFYAIPPAILTAVALPAIAVSYLRARTPEAS